MESAGELAVRRLNWRLFLAPMVALALLVGYVIYSQVGSGSPVRHLGAAAAAPKVAPKPTKLTAADLLLAATTATKGIHLEFDMVTGAPSTVHTNHAVVKSFSWGVSTPAPLAGSGGGSARPAVSDISIGKVFDKYTLPLLKTQLKGVHTPHAVLYFNGVNASGVAFDYLELDLSDVFITSYQTSSGGDFPSESLSMTFDAITLKAHIPGQVAQTLTFNIATNITTG
jgi:type VI secretion system secreted protein Hcp